MRVLLLILSGIALLSAMALPAQRAPLYDSAEETRDALERALAERQQAEARSERLMREAEAAEDAALRTARETAALAARVQQAEAGIAAAEARIGLIDRERARLAEALGREQQPLVQLTAALQQFSRRPVALSVLRPGEVRDVVYVRAMLATAVPEVRRQTAGLREQIDRSRRLRREAEQARTVLQEEEQALGQRRTELAQTATRQRLAAREATGIATREAERALALAEQARDLDALVDELSAAGTLRQRLAALPGPRLRPDRPGEAQMAPEEAVAAEADEPDAARAPMPYILPVAGRTVLGFGAPDGSRLSDGLTLAPRGGAQVVAPAAGRVAFAGPYRGFGRIVIIEHEGGWTSLVTGLAETSAEVGAELVGGAPIGLAAAERPAITVELRRSGEPVNPLAFTG